MKIKICDIDLEIPARAKKWGLRIGIPALVLSVAAVALAAPVTFSAGQTLQATDLNNNFSYLVPSGAVVAFNLSSCPAGWSALAAAQGRTIIGVNSPAANGLSQRNLGDTVGEEEHTLSVAEMPVHSHQEIFAQNGGVTCSMGYTCDRDQSNLTGTAYNTSPAGGGAAHNVMQPSVALLYCQKN